MAATDNAPENESDLILRPLPLSPGHWNAIVATMGLSRRQAEVAELIARGATMRETSSILGISISTVRTQQDRISEKTGTSGRCELLLHILDLSHRVGSCECQQQ